MARRAWTLVELLVVLGVVVLLGALLSSGVAKVRARSREARCIANLHSVGQLIHAYVQAHEDHAAPTVSDLDYYWDRGPQLGWDIRTGRWADSPGGPGSIWRCPVGRTPYMGNARALGLDASQINPEWPVYLVGPDQWHEPARLVLCYDIQTNVVEYEFMLAHALDPYAADISDEHYYGWPRDTREPVVILNADRFGPHEGQRFGVLFADGHARNGLFPGNAALLWSGPRWWE